MMSLFCLIAPGFLVVFLEGPFGRLLARLGQTRPNYLGDPIPVGFGILLAAAALPAYVTGIVQRIETQWAIPLMTAVLVFCALGAMDDIQGDRSVGGLKGHLREFVVKRRITTGLVKALAGTWVALILSAALLPHSWGDLLVTAALIALMANALNLVDTRPVRACAAFLALSAGTLLSFLPRAAPAMLWAMPGTVIGLLPVERGRRGMLGDSGANMLGATLGLSMALAFPFWGRITVVMGLVAFHIFTEVTSLNGFIERHGVLRRVDAWIQGPPPAAPERPSE